MTEIYVAAKDIPSRTLIQPDQLKKEKIPNKFVTPSHVTDAAQLQNKVFVVPLAKGDLITNNLIKPFIEVRDQNQRLVGLYSSQIWH